MKEQLVPPNALEVTDRMGAVAAQIGGGPRISKADIEDQINYVFYVDGCSAAKAGYGEALASLSFEEGYDRLQWTTICIIMLKNGYNVIGTSTPMSPANFDLQVGKVNAYENAFRQLWPLMAFSRLDHLAGRDA